MGYTYNPSSPEIRISWVWGHSVLQASSRPTWGTFDSVSNKTKQNKNKTNNKKRWNLLKIMKINPSHGKKSIYLKKNDWANPN
jgi:hypothetical protein